MRVCVSVSISPPPSNASKRVLFPGVERDRQTDKHLRTCHASPPPFLPPPHCHHVLYLSLSLFLFSLSLYERRRRRRRRRKKKREEEEEERVGGRDRQMLHAVTSLNFDLISNPNLEKLKHVSLRY